MCPSTTTSLPSIRLVHLRRALLLFAIVLGLAAIAASVSRAPEESGERTEQAAPPADPPESDGQGQPPTIAPRSAPVDRPLEAVVFPAGREVSRRVPAGEGATVLVEVDEAGQVEIPDLGLNASAEPLTPARFEIFTSDSGSHDVVFTPAAGDESREVGTLTVEPERG